MSKSWRYGQKSNRRQISVELPTLPTESQAARERFDRALERLNAIKYDFSEGSQQRWMLALHEASASRDELWRLEQHEEG
jgi:hypothetical protein